MVTGYLTSVACRRPGAGPRPHGQSQPAHRNLAQHRLRPREPAGFLAILGISWFWLYGALFLAQFPAYAKGVIGGNEGTVTLLLATFHGGHRHRLAAVREASGGEIEIGLVPFGSIGLTIFGLDLAFASPTGTAGRRAAGGRRGARQPGVVRVLLRC